MEDRRLWDRLGAKDLDPAEIVELFLNQFGRASSAEPDVVTYGDDDRPAVIVRYHREQIVAMEAGPGLTDADVAAIADVLAPEHEVQGTFVLRRVLFASVPVEGWFRYSDRFQILPVPPEAPRPPQLLADHPFLVELSVPRSTIPWLEVQRGMAAEQEIQLLLGGLVWFRITGQPVGGNRTWVLRPEEVMPVKNEDVLCAQPYYTYEGFLGTGAVLSAVAGVEPLPTEPDAEHYRRRGTRFGERLSLPDGLAALLDIFHGLASEDQVRCLRACYWLVHAERVQALSSSASFAALVQAIEALVPAGPQGDRQRFLAFVERHVPDVDGQARRALYKTRSAVVHGGKLLPSDLGRARLTLTPGMAEESVLFAAARSASQLALVSWLIETDQSATSS